MAIDPDSPLKITAFKWVPELAQGQVRDLRVRTFPWSAANRGE